MNAADHGTADVYDVPLIRVQGEPRECGRQYGSAVAEAIRDSITIYLEAFRRQHDLHENAVFELARRFVPVIEAYDAGLLDEMRGIAEGAEVPFDAVIAINARSELVHGLKARLDDGCTSFCALGEATANQRVLLGQNWDWKPEIRRTTVVLEIHVDGKPGVLTVTEAGLIGKFGLNDAGIALCINFLLSDTRRFGVPVHVIRRRVLASETLSEALRAIVKADRALAANYMIAHESGQAVDVEAWPGDVSVLHPEGGLLTHANHFMASVPGRRDLGQTIFPDSLLRERRLRGLLAAHDGTVDVGKCREALRDHASAPDSICRHLNLALVEDERIETLGSVVIDIRDRVLHFCSGLPCEGDYKPVSLKASVVSSRIKSEAAT